MEKYISRILALEELGSKYEKQLVNAILYRAFLFTLGNNLAEAGETTVGFMALFNFSTKEPVFRQMLSCLNDTLRLKIEIKKAMFPPTHNI